MSPKPGPHDGGAHPVVLAPSGAATVMTMSPGFYGALERDFPDFRGHVLIQRHGFDAPWPTWERHPEGDEYVYLLSGDADFVLWRDGREEIVRIDRPGSYVVVPRNTWHTARPHAPTVMLFVTPGEGTVNAETPQD